MTKRSVYLENLGWLSELADKADKNKRWMEAYLLTYSRIELSIILLIDHRITMTSKPKWGDEYYEHLTEGRHYLSDLIDVFCALYGDALFHALRTVNKERNNLIHAFYKRKKVNFEEYIKDLYLNALLVDNELGKVWRKEIRRGEKVSDKDLSKSSK